MQPKSLLSFDVNAGEKNLLKLKPIIEDEQPLCICLQDLPRRPASKLINLFHEIAPGYKIVPEDRISASRDDGDTIKLYNAIIAHPKVVLHGVIIRASKLPCCATRISDAIGVDFSLEPEGTVYRLYSVFFKPQACQIHLRTILQWICDSSWSMEDKMIIMGNVNSDSDRWTPPKHFVVRQFISKKTWPARRAKKINLGLPLNDFMDYLGLECLNVPELGPTSVKENKGSLTRASGYTDVVMAGKKASEIWSDFQLTIIPGSRHRLLHLAQDY